MGNVYIIPNDNDLEFVRTILTQNAADNGVETGNFSSIVRYTGDGLWFIRGVDNVRNFAKGLLQYDQKSNLVMLQTKVGSMDVNAGMLCDIYSICKPINATNITSLKFKGTINIGTIEIYEL